MIFFSNLFVAVLDGVWLILMYRSRKRWKTCSNKVSTLTVVILIVES